MTITVGGTVVVTIAGTPVGAKLTFVAGPIPGPYIPTAGSAVTHNADVVEWTLPAGLSATKGECTVVCAAYLWGAAAGVAPLHSGGTPRLASATAQATFIARGVNDAVVRQDNASQTAGATALGITNGITAIRSNSWDSVALRIYRDGVIAASDTTLSPPWTSPTVLRIGADIVTANREYNGAHSAIYTPGGLTQAERSAMARLFANRQITWAA
jgi:hypothetical protein